MERKKNNVFGYREPWFWLKRRALKTFYRNLGPIGICVGMLVWFIIIGYIEF